MMFPINARYGDLPEINSINVFCLSLRVCQDCIGRIDITCLATKADMTI